MKVNQAMKWKGKTFRHFGHQGKDGRTADSLKWKTIALPKGAD